MSDPFDRQRCIEGWEQERVAGQRCLFLGVGGVGCSLALSVARLGVGAMDLVDCDRVETSNLNRQVLYGAGDVGRLKVEAARDALLRCHVPAAGATEVRAHALDAVKDWAAVVRLARGSTVIFNGIDVGSTFDYAVLSLGHRLGVPVVSASSGGNAWEFEFCPCTPGSVSSSYRPDRCGGAPGSPQALLAPDRICDYASLETIVLRQTPPPLSTRRIGSSVLVAVSAGVNAVAAWVQYLFGNPPKNQVMGYTNSFDSPLNSIIYSEP